MISFFQRVDRFYFLAKLFKFHALLLDGGEACKTHRRFYFVRGALEVRKIAC